MIILVELFQEESNDKKRLKVLFKVGGEQDMWNGFWREKGWPKEKEEDSYIKWNQEFYEYLLRQGFQDCGYTRHIIPDEELEAKIL